MKYLKKISFILFILFFSNQDKNIDLSELNISIPTNGNSWLINDVYKSSDVISKEGITNWTDENDIIRTYFFSEKIGSIPFAIVVNNQIESSTIQIKYVDKQKIDNLQNNCEKTKTLTLSLLKYVSSQLQTNSINEPLPQYGNKTIEIPDDY